MNIEHDAAVQAAARWYATHSAQHLGRDFDRLVDRCAAHLVDLLPITTSQAARAAQLALADAASKDSPGFVDLDRCTSRLVILRDSQRNCTHMLTLPELFQLVHARTPDPAEQALGDGRR